MNNQSGRYYFKEHETDGYSVFETNEPGTPDSFIGWARTEDGARELSQRLCIEDLQKLLKALRELHPSEFKALWNAKCLPNSGIHNGAYHAPGGTDDEILRSLLENGLIQANSERRGFYRLSWIGKRLIGEEIP